MQAKTQTFVERRRIRRPFPLLCFSHLRWNFVYQRPQHLMSRFATDRKVFFFEEPVISAGRPHLQRTASSGVEVIVPHLPRNVEQPRNLQKLLDNFIQAENLEAYSLWYYTPMAMEWTRHLSPLAVVYDCMDELSNFKGASPKLKDCEAELFRRADVVFTGGYSLFHAKRKAHGNVYPFPSSIDVPHFAKARNASSDPKDQANISHPRIGFAGVIDERMDLGLVDAVAKARPDWHFVFVGPVVKIDEASLPRRRNIHYLGMKSYEQLPAYIGGWDAAMLPFARNDSTRFISPTKTPEYLAAGRPVVSTSIRDVIDPYANAGVVHIADDPEEFVSKIEVALAEDARTRIQKVDALLSNSSWSRTWGRMAELMEDAVRRRTESSRSRAAVPLGSQSAAALG